MSCVLVNGGRDRFGRGAPENRTINQTKGNKAKKKRKKVESRNEQQLHLSGHRFRLDIATFL